MLQDFNFEILHRPGLRHMNVDTLNRNLVGPTIDYDSFSEKIQDIGSIQTDKPKGEDEILSVQSSKGSKWLSFKRQEKGLLQHHECCFGINHWRYARNHQLYILDIVPEDDQQNELTPHVEENEVAYMKGSEILKDNDVRHALKRRRPQYYDKHQQLELVLAT